MKFGMRQLDKVHGCVLGKKSKVFSKILKAYMMQNTSMFH